MKIQFTKPGKSSLFFLLITCLFVSWANTAVYADDEAVPVQAAVNIIDVANTTSLNEAIAAANGNTNTEHIIRLQDNITMASNAFTISNTAGVTVTSNLAISGSPFTLTQTATSTSTSVVTAQPHRHFSVSGKLIIKDIILSGIGSGSAYNGGVLVLSGGSLTMNDGALIQRCNNSAGGGVYVYFADYVMNGGAVSGNSATNGGGVFTNQGRFTMSGNAAVTGNTATKDAGGIYNSNSVFVMDSGTISGNTAAATGGGMRNNGATAVFDMSGGEISGNRSVGDAGGGVMNMSGAKFTLSGGKISGNTSSAASGGGVNNQASAFIMTDGEISGNMAPSGGGVLNWSNSSFVMDGGTISANINTSATGKGGGVYNYGPASFTMRGGSISGHTTAGNGGGIYNTNGAVVAIESGTVSGNKAAVDGGGVWTDALTNLTVGLNAVFSNNRASAAYDRNPADDELYAAQILGTNWTSPFIQGYNNYDINYRYGTPVAYTVTYDGNGNTGGSVPTDSNVYNPNDMVTVQGQGGLAKANHTFLGWSMSQTAASVLYQDGDTFSITSDVTLYAQWSIDVPNNNTSGNNRIYGTPLAPSYPAIDPYIEIPEIRTPERGPVQEETPQLPLNPNTGRRDFDVPVLIGICMSVCGLSIKFIKKKS